MGFFRWLSFRRHSVFMMVTSLFFVITLPIYILGLGIYSWGYRTIEREITSGFYADLADSQATLEGELARIRTLQYSCLNDENLFYTINAESIMTPYERSSAFLTMQHRLEVMRESSDFIKDAQVYLPETGRMVSAAGGVKAITDEWKTILYTPADDSPSHVTYLNGNLYLCASYPIFSPDKDATPLYTLIISLDTEMLRDRLLSFNPYDSGCAVLYHSGQGFLLAKSISDALPLQIIGNQALLERLSGGESLTVEQNGEKFLVVGAFSDYMNMIFFSCVAQKDVFGGLWYYRSLFTIFFAVMLAVAVAFSAGSYYLIRRPMKRLVYSLKRVEKGDLTVRIQHSLNDEYAYLYDTFNNMANALQNLIDLNYKQTLLTQQAEMRQLQTQINPHFLYNSFFTLYRMAKDGDIDDVTEFLVYLSDYYRFITRDAHSEIPLRQEVSHAENYAHIQQIRFRRRLKVVLDELPEQVQGKRVPRLILQPVLENAFNYGFKDMVENGILHVGYRLEAGFLYIDVENNGTDVPEEMMESLRRQLAAADGLEEITGLINIHRRLKLKFGPESGLRIRHGADGGLLVTLVIPEV